MKIFLFLFLFLFLHPVISFAGVLDTKSNAVSLINMSEVFSILFSLFGVVVLILLLSYFYKRLCQINISGPVDMQQISTLQLGYKERVSLIKVGDESFLIGIAPGTVNFLTKVNIDELPQQNKLNGSCFSEKLMQAIKKRRGELEKGIQ